MKKSQDWSEYDKVSKDYGLSVDDSGQFINPERGGTGVFLKIQKGRIRFESESGALLASMPNHPLLISEFIEDFWHREKRGA
jgi:hypothetical protein